MGRHGRDMQHTTLVGGGERMNLYPQDETGSTKEVGNEIKTEREEKVEGHNMQRSGRNLKSSKFTMQNQ